MDSTESLRLYLFGYPHANVCGTPIDFRTRRAWALLAFLVLTDMEHSREAISTLLWPDHSSQRASANLRNLLWIVAKSELAPCIDVSRTTLRAASPPSLWVDIQAFRSAITEGTAPLERGHSDANPSALREAVWLYKGHLLAGLQFDASSEFEDWLQMESSALRSDLAVAHDGLLAFSADTAISQDIARARQWLLLSQDEKMALDLPSLSLKDGAGAVQATEDNAGAVPTPLTESGLRGAPRFRTPLFGRSQELKLIEAALLDPASRLISIVGPGGSGKTRLAVAAAAQSAHQFADGAHFVPLSHVETAREFILALGDTLGIPLYHAIPPERAREELSEDVCEPLRKLDALLLLDNLEQLPATYRWIAALSTPPSRLRVLTTSRHQLELQEECVVSIDGLDLADPHGSIDDIRTSEAVRLFVTLARLTMSGFTPSPDEWRAIAYICESLEGMPLAIELAASWIRSSSCVEIAPSVEATTADLEASDQDSPARHRSLRAVFLSSWTRLRRSERASLRRLAAFHGPFTLQAAHEIVGLSPTTLAGLVRRSLLRRRPDGRYELLRIFRELLDERLRALPDEYATVHSRHADYYLKLLIDRAPHLRTARQKEATEAIVGAFENIEAAWRSAVERGAFATLLDASEPLWSFLMLQSQFVDGVALFDLLASTAQQHDSELAREAHAFASTHAGWFLIFGDEEAGIERMREARARTDGSARGRREVIASTLLCIAEQGSGAATTVSISCIDRCLDYFESVNDTEGQALALEARALSLAGDNDHDALAILQQCLDLRTQSGDQWGIASALVEIGAVLVNLKDCDQAETVLQGAVRIHRTLGADPFGEMGAWTQLAHAARFAKRLESARDRYEVAYNLAQTIGARVARGSTAECLARINLALGERDEARRYAEEAISIYREGGDAKRLTRCLAFADFELGYFPGKRPT